MGEDKPYQEAIWGCGSQDIKKDLMETRGDTMDKDSFPETSDKNHLEEWPDSD